VSEIHNSEFAGVPASVAIRDDAKMSMLALRIVSDVEPVERTNDQSPNESGVRRAFKARPEAAA
jgi:hypothetical protein